MQLPIPTSSEHMPILAKIVWGPQREASAAAGEFDTWPDARQRLMTTPHRARLSLRRGAEFSACESGHVT